MKAIFIVNLRQLATGSGIPKVIANKDNVKVKNFLFDGRDSKLKQDQILLIESPTSIEIINQYPTSNSASEHEIIIIRDDADDEIFQNEALFKDACVVYHEAAGNNTVRERTTLWRSHKILKPPVKGVHESNQPNNPYNALNNIFECLQNKFDFDKLIGEIEKQICPDKKLEAVLEFLHLCLNDTIENGYLKILQDAGIEVGNGDDDSIKTLFEKVKNPGRGNMKNQELAALRDAMLAKVGIV